MALPSMRVLVVIDDDDIVRIAAEPAVVLVAPPEDVELGEVGRVVQQLVHAVDDVAGLVAQDRVGQRLDDHLRRRCRPGRPW